MKKSQHHNNGEKQQQNRIHHRTVRDVYNIMYTYASDVYNNISFFFFNEEKLPRIVYAYRP